MGPQWFRLWGILTKEEASWRGPNAELEVAELEWELGGEAVVATKPRGRKKRSSWRSPAQRPSLTSLRKVGPLPRAFFCLIPLICFIQNVDHKLGFSGVFAFVGTSLCPWVSSLSPGPDPSSGLYSLHGAQCWHREALAKCSLGEGGTGMK